MERVPPIPPESMNSTQQGIYDAIFPQFKAAFEGKFEYARADGAMMHTPNVIVPYLQHVTSLKSSDGPSDLVLEVATIATAAHNGCDYVLYSHRVLGKEKGLTDAQIDALEAGDTPADLDEPSAFALDATKEMWASKFRLGDGTWKKGVALFGLAGMVTLLQTVAQYSYVCVIFNTSNVPRPDQVGETSSGGIS